MLIFCNNSEATLVCLLFKLSAMALIDSLIDRKDFEFFDEHDFESSLSSQLTLAPKVLSIFNRFSSEVKTRRLDYFFYTDTQEKALALAADLEKLAYNVEVDAEPGVNGLFCISGQATAIKMTTEAMISWTRNMCELGYQNDCRFDGWGTGIDAE